MVSIGHKASYAGAPAGAAVAAEDGQATERPFNLERWFAILGLLSIVLISTASAVFLSRFLNENMLHRDAVVSMTFIESIVRSGNGHSYFVDKTGGPANPALEDFFVRISQMPEVARANVYARDGAVIWSSDANLIGRRLGYNDELEEAFAGELEVETGIVGVIDKSEHLTFGPAPDGTKYVENYIPIWDREGNQVIGVVELYKLPTALFESIAAGSRQIWGIAIAGAIFLYATLFWIVRHASNVIRNQHSRLIDAETLAAIGEMSSAVAHGIRNPLASIRSSAELALHSSDADARESAHDVIVEADRLDKWVRNLLTYSMPERAASESVDLRDIVDRTLSDFEPAMARQKVELALSADPHLPLVTAGGASLAQVFGCLVENALEAMQGPGRLSVDCRVDTAARAVEVKVTDSGPGLSPEVARTVFRPFVTTKSSGLGLGLALSRRIMERYGGTLDLVSAGPRGAVAVMRVPIAE